MKPISSDYYDATRQAVAWWESHADDGLWRNVDYYCNCLKSRMRFDYLFSNKISVQRGDLLDGAVFQHTRPKDIRDWLGPKAKGRPLQVRTVSGGLEKDLLDWVKRKGETTLHAEPFLLIPKEKDEQYRREFRKLKRNAIRNAGDLANAIGKVTGDKDLGKHFSKYWQSWIDDTDCVELTKVDPSKVDYGTRLIDLTRLVPYVVSLDHVDDAVRIYVEAVEEFLRTPDHRGNLFRRLTDELPEILPWVNNRIAVARAEADGIKHESLINVHVDDPSLRKKFLRLLTADPGFNDENSFDVTLPDILPQWLVVCEYDKLLKQIENFRTPYLQTQNETNLKRLVEAITNVMAADNTYKPLPEPQAGVDRIARCFSIGVGAAWTVANLYTGSLENFTGISLGVDIMPTVIAGGLEISGKTKKYLRDFTQSLAKQEIIDQTIHTFRRRGGVE